LIHMGANVRRSNEREDIARARRQGGWDGAGDIV